MERGKLDMWRNYSPKKHETWENESITKGYSSESGGMSYEVPVMGTEQQPLDRVLFRLNHNVIQGSSKTKR